MNKMKDWFKNIIESKQSGLYGTILFHLILVVILLSMKLHSIQRIIELELEYKESNTEELLKEEQLKEEREEIRKKKDIHL